MAQSRFIEKKVVTHNPGYIIVQGLFRKDNGELAFLTYYVKRDAPELWGHEYYSGENYIPSSKENSYSRNYLRGNALPKKYRAMAEELKNVVHTL